MIKQSDSLSKEEFDQLSRVITSRTGLVFPKSRESELRQCLLEGFRESQDYPSFGQYLSHIEVNALDKHDMRDLIARLTVGETYFFRNKPQFDLLRKDIIPKLVQKRKNTTRTLRFWSAGCSTGEEAYSLAMLLRDTIPDIEKWNIFILATDISEESLRFAARGEYRDWSFREVGPTIKSLYFTATDQGYKLNPEVRKMVTFQYLNLIENSYPLASNGTNFMDMILCRNVMIYFMAELNATITRRFYRALNSDGYLIVGHTEHPDHIYQGFNKEMHPHAVIYFKKETSTDLDRGLRIRFRGSGALPTNVVPYHRPKKKPTLKKKVDDGKERHQEKQETIYFEEGSSAYKLGHNKIAREKFQKVLELNPKNHRACYMIALMEADRNHIQESEEFCLKAIKGYALSLEAHYLMTVIAREKGDKEKELEYLKKVLYIDRNFILGHFQMGVYYCMEGNNVLSRKHFNNTLKLLDKWNKDDYIDGTEGMTVGYLVESVGKYMEEIESKK